MIQTILSNKFQLCLVTGLGFSCSSHYFGSLGLIYAALGLVTNDLRLYMPWAGIHLTMAFGIRFVYIRFLHSMPVFCKAAELYLKKVVEVNPYVAYTTFALSTLASWLAASFIENIKH